MLFEDVVYTQCPKASLFIFCSLTEVKTVNYVVEWGKAERKREDILYATENKPITSVHQCLKLQKLWQEF